jgi:hypothetical protein
VADDQVHLSEPRVVVVVVDVDHELGLLEERVLRPETPLVRAFERDHDILEESGFGPPRALRTA